MKSINHVIYIVCILLLISACYYDSEEDLFPQLETECDLENITFSTDVSEILQNKCWSCHSNANAAVFGNNIRIEDYKDVKTQFDAILGTVNFLSGYSPMPKNGGKLSNCELDILDKWNSDGKINN